jgi:hypothetical protein
MTVRKVRPSGRADAPSARVPSRWVRARQQAALTPLALQRFVIARYLEGMATEPHSPYRAPVPRPPDPYLVEWSDLRRRRLWLSASLIALPTAVIWPVLVMTRVGPSLPVTAMAIVAFAIVPLSIHAERFRCPRCAEWFCRKGLYHNGFARRCLHCGIKVGTPKD